MSFRIVVVLLGIGYKLAVPIDRPNLAIEKCILIKAT